MPSLTDGAIRQAIKRVVKSRQQMSLADGEGRGTGRLVLILKPMPTRVTAEWMAQQWRDGRRTKSKIGSYPAMPLSEAREIFKRLNRIVDTLGRNRLARDVTPDDVLGVLSRLALQNPQAPAHGHWPDLARPRILSPAGT